MSPSARVRRVQEAAPYNPGALLHSRFRIQPLTRAHTALPYGVSTRTPKNSQPQLLPEGGGHLGDAVKGGLQAGLLQERQQRDVLVGLQELLE